ncbi:MAG TPA: ankyrin repeat domain-containing protein, partial [bacterium]|nr:ankyrin repeat domain-containing protein [bacterium]
LVAFDTLQSAIQSNDTEAVRKKLEGDVDVNSQADNEQGFTALMYAAGMGNQEIVSLLLAKNADPNISALDGSVPLHFAARAGNLEIVQMVLDKGADANAQDKSGRTALAWAQKEQHDAVVTLLQGRTTAEAQKPEQVEETEEIKEPEQTEQ